MFHQPHDNTNHSTQLSRRLQKSIQHHEILLDILASHEPYSSITSSSLSTHYPFTFTIHFFELLFSARMRNSTAVWCDMMWYIDSRHHTVILLHRGLFKILHHITSHHTMVSWRLIVVAWYCIKCIKYITYRICWNTWRDSNNAIINLRVKCF